VASPMVALESPLGSGLDPGVGAALHSALESALFARGEAAEGGLSVEDSRDPCQGEGLGGLDRRLAVLCRERGPLRAVLARIASRLVFVRAWERIGYARLSDYAVECLGISGRSVRSLAEVGTKLGERPRVEDALVSGTLGWTKVRLLARLPRGEDEAAWIAYARRVTAEELSKAVRAVDRGSVEAGAAEEEGARSRLFEVRCTPEVRWKWFFTRGAAARAAGRVLHVSEAAELIAAEVLSALPLDEGAEEGACEEAGVSWSQESEPVPEPVPDPAASELCETQSVRGEGATAADTARHPPWRRDEAHTRPPWRGDNVLTALRPRGDKEHTALGTRGEEGHTALRPQGNKDQVHMPLGTRGEGACMALRPRANDEKHRLPAWRRAAAEEDRADTGNPTFRRERSSLLSALALPPALAPFLDRLEEADAFALDERFRRALSMEQSLDARIGPLLAQVWGRFVHRALGYASREAYARDRLGMDPTRARALVRLERAAALSEAFARAYRTGALSWVKASLLAPLVSGDLLGWFVEDWVAWAGRVTVRRLGEDVERALALGETDPGEFRRSGGLPPEASDDREIGATTRGTGQDVVVGEKADHLATDDREIGAAERGGNEDVVARGDREIGATERAAEPCLNRHPEPLKSAPDEVCWARFFGPPDVVQLFRAVLCTVRRRMEKDIGRLPTAGEALGAMLDHVLASWGEIDAKVAAHHRVSARDGWRCAVPGCTSMQNLHDHHIRFRSAQGEDALENRITLCAFHHLRGVHR